MTRDRLLLLLCACRQAGVVPAERVEALRGLLANRGVLATVVADLCALAAETDALSESVRDVNRVVVAACHPRASLWLVRAAGVNVPAEKIKAVDIRLGSVEEVADTLCEDGGSASAVETAPMDEGWPAWFPVIDYDRCVDCEQCLSFCPFGVYSKGMDGRVHVTMPRSCKYNCPACARICPQGAIMFPKCSDEAISGAPVEAVASTENSHRDLDTEFDRADIHTLLAERRQRAQAKRKGRDPE